MMGAQGREELDQVVGLLDREPEFLKERLSGIDTIFLKAIADAVLGDLKPGEANAAS